MESICLEEMLYMSVSAFLHLCITDHKRRIYVVPSRYRSLWFRIPINVVKLQVNWPPIVVICQSVVPSRTSSGGDSSWPSLTWHGVVSLANVSQSGDQIPFVIFVPLEMLGYLRSYYIDYDCPSVRLSVLQSFCMSVRPDIYSIIREWNNHTERILLINVNLVKRM